MDSISYCELIRLSTNLLEEGVQFGGVREPAVAPLHAGRAATAHYRDQAPIAVAVRECLPVPTQQPRSQRIHLAQESLS